MTGADDTPQAAIVEITNADEADVALCVVLTGPAPRPKLPPNQHGTAGIGSLVDRL